MSTTLAPPPPAPPAAPPAPAAPGPPDRRGAGPRAVRAVLAGVLLPSLFIVAFVVPGHDPEPNGLNVVQAGVPARVVAGLAKEGVNMKTVDDRAAGERAVRDRDAYGAFVPGRDGRTELVVASGASAVTAAQLKVVAAAKGIPVAEDLAPLPKGDPRGVTLNLLVLPLIVTSVIGALLAISFLPEISARFRTLLTALTGAITGLVAVGILHLLDALPGSYLAEAGLVALLVTGIALTGGAIVRALGPPALMVAFMLFLVIGNPASGLASAPELLPTPWKEVGALLPPGALGDALRGTAWFDGASVGGPILVLLAWIVIGAGAHVLLDRRRAAKGSAALIGT